MVIEHLEAALDELQMARTAGGVGTAMRIDTAISQVQSIKEDTETIHSDGDR